MARRRKRFIDYVNNKYQSQVKEVRRDVGDMFKHYDDYACYMFFNKFKGDYERYYEQVEKDLKEYSDMQTGYTRYDLNLEEDSEVHDD